MPWCRARRTSFRISLWIERGRGRRPRAAVTQVASPTAAHAVTAVAPHRAHQAEQTVDPAARGAKERATALRTRSRRVLRESRCRCDALGICAGFAHQEGTVLVGRTRVCAPVHPSPSIRARSERRPEAQVPACCHRSCCRSLSQASLKGVATDADPARPGPAPLSAAPAAAGPGRRWRRRSGRPRSPSPPAAGPGCVRPRRRRARGCWCCRCG